ncbi:MAG: DNA-binding protein [Lachnospiraceae bacterium]|nr:DNA-binding protein [Lachnospiraceae bacterium]
MEKIVKQSLLYDFYGELLTEHQKSVYEDYVLNDIGISEIAEERGISRQGVHDLIKRCDKILDGYEEKLHLLERFSQVKEDVSDMKNSIAKIKCDNLDESDKELVNEVINKLESIIDKL